MSRSEEVARRKMIQESADWRFQWWRRTDAVALLEGLLAEVPNLGRDALLLCQRANKPNGEEVLWFWWGTAADLKEGVEAVTTLNHGFDGNLSHPCEPCCPDCPG